MSSNYVNVLLNFQYADDFYIFQAMVQCVSSSEPDSVVSPRADSAQSPSNLEYFDRNTGKKIVNLFLDSISC